MLATRMPAFRADSEPLQQHKIIHQGMDKLKTYLTKCQTGACEFRRSEVRIILDSFGEILWTHLDDEVAQLHAEKMKAHWTLPEMRGLMI